jgi:hypothetical protein
MFRILCQRPYAFLRPLRASVGERAERERERARTHTHTHTHTHTCIPASSSRVSRRARQERERESTRAHTHTRTHTHTHTRAYTYELQDDTHPASYTLSAKRLLLISAASRRRVRSPFLPVSAARSLPARSAYLELHVSIRQHTSAYVSIRQARQ